MKYDYLIVGAGFAGSVMAERIASQFDKKVLLVEKRPQIGGNAYDEYDDHGILVHRYGPHIFHTNSLKVFEYLSKFTEWIPYEHRVLASYRGNLYPIPINRITLNKLYNLDFKSEEDVEKYYTSVKEKRYPVMNSEDVIVGQIGSDLFEIFFKGYSYKQWRKYPIELSPSVCGRIPVRTNDDCRYFGDKYQYMPKLGYTKMFQNILSGKNIDILLNTDYKQILNDYTFDKIIYTGPIDYFFDHMHGELPYRSIRFEFENHEVDKIQETGVINYVETNIPFTRVTEYKHLTGQKAGSTTLSKEYSEPNGEPYYPIPTQKNLELYSFYAKEAAKLKNVLFCGRLAGYRYYNMDQMVAHCLIKINSFL
jgi:UDP-galactopyranose mutase